jgi:hypothetical protein
MPDNDIKPPLSVVMEKKEDIPEMYQELFQEQGGKFVLTGITGIKTQADVERVQASLQTEREAHKKTKERLRPFVEYSDEQIKAAQEWIDKRAELEATLEAAGKVNDETINKIVETRITSRLAPVERAKTEIETKYNEALKQVAVLAEEKRIRFIHDAVREARPDSKYVEDAEPDILMVAERMLQVGEDGKITTKEGVGVTPGLTPKEWLVEMMPKRKHWWPATEGGGAPGNRGTQGYSNNPWSETYWNKTEQAKIVRDDPQRAELMAKAAGVTIDAVRPRKKA